MTALAARAGLGWPRVLVAGAVVGAAAVLLVGLFAAAGSEKLGYDFNAAYLPAAEAIRDGRSPYVDPESSVVAEERAYVYLPQLAIALVPLTVVPRDVASVLAVLAALGALAGALAAVGVRDVSCYAAAVLWAPTWNALEMANVSALLALAVALAWRWRDRVWQPAVALGLAVSTKLVLWPMLVWMAFTRRLRAAAATVAVGVAAAAVSWAVIGFAGLAEYPELLRRLSEAQSGRSYSFVGLAGALGLSEPWGQVAAVVVGGGLLAACALLARREEDLRSLACAIGAALALSPIVWQHYLVLLLVPLAIARPRFSAVWLLPVVLWVSPRAGNGEGVETILPALVAATLLAVILWRPTGREAVAVGG